MSKVSTGSNVAFKNRDQTQRLVSQAVFLTPKRSKIDDVIQRTEENSNERVVKSDIAKHEKGIKIDISADEKQISVDKNNLKDQEISESDNNFSADEDFNLDITVLEREADSEDETSNSKNKTGI